MFIQVYFALKQEVKREGMITLPFKLKHLYSGVYIKEHQKQHLLSEFPEKKKKKICSVYIYIYIYI